MQGEAPRSRATRGRTSWALALAGLLALTLGAAAAPAEAAPGPGPYFAAPFRVHANSFDFGQAPSWSGGGVLSNEPDRAGTEQVYASRLDGARRRCLTCGRIAGPNGFPAERPTGGWILFCSMGAQPEHFGASCLGGYSSDLYAMRTDGSRVTRLTRASDPVGGARYDTRPGGVPYDNYHPYWSPDGRHVVWTRAEARPLDRGGQRWQMMLADFVARRHDRPHLAHIRVVGPAFGVYETQAWAPDGSGFLFTAFGPRRSPFDSTNPGWMNLELYFMRLYGRGASPAHPRVTHITDDDPTHEEQAVFTPDMRDVIFMTSRGRPGTWYQAIVTAAQWLGFDAPDPGSAGAPMFLLDFSDPRFTTDLYMIDVATGAIRRLTHFGHVIPEFAWNAGHTRLLWTENVRPGRRITRVGRFAGISHAERRAPPPPAPGLFGRPIDMARVRGSGRAAAPPRSPLAQSPRSAPTRLAGQATVPPVATTYLALLFGELGDLAARAGAGFPQLP